MKKISDLLKENEQLKEKVEAYKKLCSIVQAETKMPQLLIDYPEFLFGKQDISTEDIEWAKKEIEEYLKKKTE